MDKDIEAYVENVREDGKLDICTCWGHPTHRSRQCRRADACFSLVPWHASHLSLFVSPLSALTSRFSPFAFRFSPLSACRFAPPTQAFARLGTTR